LINNNNNNNNNIYSGSSTHRSVFQGGPVIYIYIIHGKLYYAYLKTIKYLKMDYYLQKKTPQKTKKKKLNLIR
jgi:hypothetical protein